MNNAQKKTFYQLIIEKLKPSHFKGDTDLITSANAALIELHEMKIKMVDHAITEERIMTTLRNLRDRLPASYHHAFDEIVSLIRECYQETVEELAKNDEEA